MPTNNFKLFDQNKANMLTDTEYTNAAQRLNGVQTGVASSQLNNKFAYQVSLVAYAIAQIMNQNNLDASDTLAVSAFVGNLGSALLQKVADKASTTEAAAGVLNNKYITPATMKAAALLISGGTMTGPIAMGNNKITGLATPTATEDAATKGYVDSTKTTLETEIGKVEKGIILKRKTIYSATNLTVTKDGLQITTTATAEDIDKVFAIRIFGDVNLSDSYEGSLYIGIGKYFNTSAYSSCYHTNQIPNTQFDSTLVIDYVYLNYKGIYDGNKSNTYCSQLLDKNNPSSMFLSGGRSSGSQYTGTIVFSNLEIQLLLNT